MASRFCAIPALCAHRTPETLGPDPNMHAMAEILEVVTQAPIRKRSITNHAVLNEAYDYA